MSTGDGEPVVALHQHEVDHQQPGQVAPVGVDGGPVDPGVLEVPPARVGHAGESDRGRQQAGRPGRGRRVGAVPGPGRLVEGVPVELAVRAGVGGELDRNPAGRTGGQARPRTRAGPAARSAGRPGRSGRGSRPPRRRTRPGPPLTAVNVPPGTGSPAGIPGAAARAAVSAARPSVARPPQTRASRTSAGSRRSATESWSERRHRERAAQGVDDGRGVGRDGRSRAAPGPARARPRCAGRGWPAPPRRPPPAAPRRPVAAGRPAPDVQLSSVDDRRVSVVNAGEAASSPWNSPSCHCRVRNHSGSRTAAARPGREAVRPRARLDPVPVRDARSQRHVSLRPAWRSRRRPPAGRRTRWRPRRWPGSRPGTSSAAAARTRRGRPGRARGPWPAPACPAASARAGRSSRPGLASGGTATQDGLRGLGAGRVEVERHARRPPRGWAAARARSRAAAPTTAGPDRRRGADQGEADQTGRAVAGPRCRRPSPAQRGASPGSWAIRGRPTASAPSDRGRVQPHVRPGGHGRPDPGQLGQPALHCGVRVVAQVGLGGQGRPEQVGPGGPEPGHDRQRAPEDRGQHVGRRGRGGGRGQPAASSARSPRRRPGPPDRPGRRRRPRTRPPRAAPPPTRPGRSGGRERVPGHGCSACRAAAARSVRARVRGRPSAGGRVVRPRTAAAGRPR